MAECHPVGFRWVMKAKERGATIIHVDPRFTRTSAVAEIFVPIRAGSDIAFLGGIVRYILENERYFQEYVVNYTNAAAILHEGYEDAADNDGFFSGWNAEKSQYDQSTWMYHGVQPSNGTGEKQPIRPALTDPTLQHPRCVFQVLKRHFSRYSPEMVERTCGIPRERLIEVAEALCRNSGRERTSAFCYAVGWTQHTVGVQYIRTACIIQLLLGNMGRPGGGIMALRGHASIQGSTDIPTLYDLLPGYLPMPLFGEESLSLDSYLKKHSSRTGVWSSFDKYFISLMKAYYGEGARQENEWGFQWLPRLTGDHSHFGYWLDMADGKLEGLFVMGQNPAVGAANGRLERKALARLKWLVVRDMVETETASFWYASPEVERGELSPETIATEVFLFPAAGTAEKEGTFTNTQRLLQHREKAVDPPGEARSETWFMVHLGRRLKELAQHDSAKRNDGLRSLTWDYSTEGAHAEPRVEEVLREINGWSLRDHRQLQHIRDLKNDGSTACGAWIYCGVFPEENRNRARERKSK